MNDVTQWAVTRNQADCWVSLVWSSELWKVPVIAAKLTNSVTQTLPFCSFQHFFYTQQNIRQIPEGRSSGTSVYGAHPQFWGRGRFSCRSEPTANWNDIIASSLLLLLHIRTCLALLTCWGQQIHHIPVRLLRLSGGWYPGSPPYVPWWECLWQYEFYFTATPNDSGLLMPENRFL